MERVDQAVGDGYLVVRVMERRQISAGHARALITAEDPMGLARDIIRRGLSVRETEKLAKKSGGNSIAVVDELVERLDKIRNRTPDAIRISDREGRGRIEIAFIFLLIK